MTPIRQRAAAAIEEIDHLAAVALADPSDAAELLAAVNSYPGPSLINSVTCLLGSVAERLPNLGIDPENLEAAINRLTTAAQAIQGAADDHVDRARDLIRPTAPTTGEAR